MLITLGMVRDLRPGDLFWAYDLNLSRRYRGYAFCLWNVSCETSYMGIEVPGNKIGFVAEGRVYERTFRSAKETCLAHEAV